VSSVALVMAAAALLLFAAALVGYAVPRWRRRALAGGDDSGRIARENGLTQMSRWVTETGDRRSERPVTPTQPAKRRALGYTTFPERKRAVSPEGRYQARRIRAACEARGMELHQLVGDVQSYSGPDLERPGLTHALDMLANGEASCLVVAGLDRLSTSAANLGTVIEWLDDIGARLVVIDIDLDTESEEGRLAARALTRIGALERRSGLAPTPRPAPRERSGGTRGRPAVADLPLLQRRIATMRASGMTLQAIADTLNKEGVPTLRGGSKWRPSSVQAATGYKRPSRHATEPAGAERDRDS
jgi:DNA invertase Pin-like site-specific DNA recombinase